MPVNPPVIPEGNVGKGALQAPPLESTEAKTDW